jgi:maleate cis-trans isomerase
VIQPIIKPSVHKVSFVSPPSWFDISSMEFLRIVPSNIIVVQTIMRPPDFGYNLEQFVNSVPEVGVCFDSLAVAGANVVAKFGYPFSLVHGWEKTQQIQKSIQGNRETHFVMMGVEVVYALKRFNCKSVAIASTYYSESMSKIRYPYQFSRHRTVWIDFWHYW